MVIQIFLHLDGFLWKAHRNLFSAFAPLILRGSNSHHNVLVNPTSEGIYKLYVVLHDPYPYCDPVGDLSPKSTDRLFLLTGVHGSNIYMHLCFCRNQGTHHRTSMHIFYTSLLQNTPSAQPTCSRKQNICMSYFRWCSFPFAADVCFLSTEQNPHILLSSRNLR